MKKALKINLRDIEYYFDSIARDISDRGQLSDQNTRWLAIKKQLFLLPNNKLNALLELIENQVSHNIAQSKESETEKKKKLALICRQVKSCSSLL